MYYPVFRHLKSQVKELDIIHSCDEYHKKVFAEVPIIGFKNNKNLKSHLVRAALTDINEIGRCEPCGGKRPPCQLCNNMKNTSTSKSKHSNEVYQIKKNFILKKNSKMVVYLVEYTTIGFAESNTMVVPRQNFVQEPITIKTHIIIFRKSKNCQTKSVTRNVFINIICRMTLIGFVTGRSK